MMRMYVLTPVLMLVACAVAEPVRNPQPPPVEAPREKLAIVELDAEQTKSAAQRIDRLVDLSEIWQKSFREQSPDAPSHFETFSAEARSISTTYIGTTFDALAAFQLANAYELQRKHDHAIALFQQLAARLGGTTYGSIALVHEASYRLRWNLDLPAARDAASRVASPPEPTPDERNRGVDRFPVTRSTYYRAQITLCRIDARLEARAAALARLRGLPETVQNPDGEFSQELRLLTEDLAKATKE